MDKFCDLTRVMLSANLLALELRRCGGSCLGGRGGAWETAPPSSCLSFDADVPQGIARRQSIWIYFARVCIFVVHFSDSFAPFYISIAMVPVHRGLGIHLRLVGVRPAVEDRSTDGIACVVRSPCVAPPSPSNRRGPYRDLPFQRSFRSLDESSAYVEVPRIHPFPPGIGSVVGHVVVFDRDGMTGVGFARSFPSGLDPRWMGVHVTPPLPSSVPSGFRHVRHVNVTIAQVEETTHAHAPHAERNEERIGEESGNGYDESPSHQQGAGGQNRWIQTTHT
eukprot:scaffold116_cov334-Pavlova_lutheri.AAC.78